MKRLMEELKLDQDDARKIKELAKAVDNKAAFENLLQDKHKRTLICSRMMFNDPFASSMWRRTLMLHAIDQVLHTCGIEIIGKDTENFRYEYLNNGDMYAPTIFHDRKEDRLLIGSWCDFAPKDK